MKPHGLLDGFPLHLFAGGGARSVVVVLDRPELGRLRLDSVPRGDRTVIAVSEDRDCLERTRESMNGATGGGVLVVQCDPNRLPFRNQSVHGVVAIATNGTTRNGQGEGGEPFSAEVQRVLDGKGSRIDLAPSARRRPRREADDDRSARACSYVVRPACGRQYFVTREWLPRPWPFRAIQMGRVRSVQLGLDRLFSRLGIRPLYDSVSVEVRTRGPGLLDRWPVENFGLCAKAERSALLLGARSPGRFGGPIVVRFPLSAISVEQLDRHAQALRDLRQEADGQLRRVVPRLVEQGTAHGQRFASESKLAGVTSSNWWWIPGSRIRASKLGFRALLDLHRSTARPITVNRGEFGRLVGPLAAVVETGTREVAPGFDLQGLLDRVYRRLEGRRLPLVRTHGDFGPENLLVSRDWVLKGIPDWEASRKRGWPMLDLLNLIVARDKQRYTTRFGSCVTDQLLSRRMAHWERAMVDTYSAALGLDADLWNSLVSLYWLETVALFIRTDCSVEWLTRNALQPLQPLLAAVSEPAKPVPSALEPSHV